MATSGNTSTPERRGFTFRSFFVCIFALLLMGIWIQYEEVFNFNGGPLAENSPPNSAVGVILAVMGIGALLYRFRRSLRLRTGELVVIYSALVMAAPLMTQGFWHRIIGLVSAFPHYQDFKSYDSLPPMLWPHGENLIPNAGFQEGLKGFRHVGGELKWEEMRDRHGQMRQVPVLRDGALEVTIPRSAGLVPRENFLFSARVKAEGLTKESAYFVEIGADDTGLIPVLVNSQNTAPTFADPTGFARVGVNPVAIPGGLREKLTLRIGIRGGGTLAVQEMEFMNMEAVESLFVGRQVVRESRLEALTDDERNSTMVRPDNLWSLAGLKFLAAGYIPFGQWVQPMLAWGALIAALFVGFLGLNVLLRKQWVEHERFTFPLTILPKNIFQADRDEGGRIILPLFRSRVMWIGFCIAFLLALLKGLKFYFPKVPALVFPTVGFSAYVGDPIFQAYLSNVGFGIGFMLCLYAIFLLIETDILFSLWSMFLVFQLWNLFGRLFGLTAIPGYPWESQQTMGGYIAYAILAVVVARTHLWRVMRIMAGRGTADELAMQRQEMVGYRVALLLVVVSLVGLGAWGWWTRMGVGASLLFFGYMLICGFAASRIRAECGAPFGYITPYNGMQFLAAMGGFVMFKSVGMVVATIAAGFMCTSCFLLMAPVQVEMMELGRRFEVRPKDVGAGLTLGLVGGVLIGGFVILCWAYAIGASNFKYSWPYAQNWYFENLRVGASNVDRALAAGTLGQAPEAQPLNFSANLDAKGLGVGAVITGALAFLRAKVMWFPFHPLGYLLASTNFMRQTWLLVFLAWLARLVLFRMGGAIVIRRGLVPFALGMFLGCIASIVVFDVVGLILRAQGVVEVYSRMP